ncbi:MAG: hypothetical protein H7318_14855 [Oligoflexus sp.]|nr:hypothetical protein [Oligoflexus sp.]
MFQNFSSEYKRTILSMFIVAPVVVTFALQGCKGKFSKESVPSISKPYRVDLMEATSLYTLSNPEDRYTPLYPVNHIPLSKVNKDQSTTPLKYFDKDGNDISQAENLIWVQDVLQASKSTIFVTTNKSTAAFIRRSDGHIFNIPTSDVPKNYLESVVSSSEKIVLFTTFESDGLRTLVKYVIEGDDISSTVVSGVNQGMIEDKFGNAYAIHKDSDVMLLVSHILDDGTLSTIDHVGMPWIGADGLVHVFDRRKRSANSRVLHGEEYTVLFTGEGNSFHLASDGSTVTPSILKWNTLWQTGDEFPIPVPGFQAYGTNLIGSEINYIRGGMLVYPGEQNLSFLEDSTGQVQQWFNSSLKENRVYNKVGSKMFSLENHQLHELDLEYKTDRYIRPEGMTGINEVTQISSDKLVLSGPRKDFKQVVGIFDGAGPVQEVMTLLEYSGTKERVVVLP